MATHPPPANLSDLVALARSGDDRALEELLATLEPTVQRFGRRLCRQDDDADDVKQDTLLALSRHLGDFEERASHELGVCACAKCLRAPPSGARQPATRLGKAAINCPFTHARQFSNVRHMDGSNSPLGKKLLGSCQTSQPIGGWICPLIGRSLLVIGDEID